jgi:aspartate racemase
MAELGRPAQVLGVVGGMGPLASAAFVQTVYERRMGEREQEAPVVLLVSDPTVPDRTEALRRGDDAALFDSLVRSLRWLTAGGAGELVICCMTAHHLFGRLPAELRRRTRSLVDQLCEDLAAAPGRHLLLATRGTRELGIFERHPRWREVEDRIVLPSAADQEAVHGLLYRLKLCAPPELAVPEVEGLLARYRADAFVAGCTELHLLTRHLAAAGSGPAFLDPLMSIAAGAAPLAVTPPGDLAVAPGPAGG